MNEGFVALGSNLQNPVHQVKKAATLLQNTSGIESFQLSALYHTPPMGPVAQPDYVNAVCRFKTAMTAQELLLVTQGIEIAMRRTKEVRWGPRVIDLDLLILGQLRIDAPSLTLPHPGLLSRDFVLVPLYDVAPKLKLPNGHHISEWLESLKPFKLRRIESTELNNASSQLVSTSTI